MGHEERWLMMAAFCIHVAYWKKRLTNTCYSLLVDAIFFKDMMYVITH